MAVYVIARRGIDDLETEVFSAGAEQQDEAVAVFCDKSTAATYIANAHWNDSHTVAEIASVDLPFWLCGLHRDGIRFLAVDPVREEQECNLSQPMIEIRSLLNEAGEIMIKRLRAPAPPAALGELHEIVVYHCQNCGKVMRRQPDAPAPVCCNKPMTQAATDTIREPVTANSR